MSTNEDFLNALDSEKSREIVKALDEYKAGNGINRELAPFEIIDAAKDPGSILHRYFDWDDKSAAHKQRMDTARRLIASVRYIVREEGRVTYRAFASVKESPSDPRRYERISRVLSDEALQQARLGDFQRRLAGILSEFADLDQAWLEPVVKVRNKVSRQMKKFSDAA